MKNKQDSYQEILDEIQENLSETERDWYADEERKILMREEMMNDPEAREALDKLHKDALSKTLKEAGLPKDMSLHEYMKYCEKQWNNPE